VRKVGIQQGNTNWTIGATEWDVYPQNTFTFLGSHTMTSCAPLLNPTVSFSSAATVVPESNTTVTVTVNISPAGTTNSTSVTVSIGAASTATGGTDYTYAPVTLTWLAGDSTPQTVTVNIIDDATPEGSETVELTLTSPTNNATVSGPNHVITITDNDFPTYNIGQINAVNALGVGDSIGLKCWIQGTVYGVNLRATGIQFTLRDNTGGIGVFNGAAFPGYTTVTETDTMKILGTINQFNGLLQIDPDSIVVIGTGAILKQPTVVTTLVEANESDLLQFNAGRLVNPAQWTGTGSGFNVDVTDGTNTITVRIDNDVNLYSQPAPTGIFTVCGLGSQFDNASPFDAGYQLMPRYTQDIKVLLDLDLGPDQQGCAGDSFTLDAGPAQAYLWSTGDTTQTITVPVGGTYWVEVTDTTYNVTDTDTIVLNQTPATVAAFNANQLTGFDFQFNNSSIGATAYSWDFGDGNTSTAASPTHTYGIPGSYAVTLIATGPCNSDTTDTLVVAFVGIDAGLDLGISLFPVPTEGEFSVLLEKGTHSSTILTITDLTGKVLVAERFNQWMAGESKSFRIDLPGVYFLNLQTDEGTQQRKLVVH
jgi:hypothetical protein